jgi:hypothetical protein
MFGFILYFDFIIFLKNIKFKSLLLTISITELYSKPLNNNIYFSIIEIVNNYSKLLEVIKIEKL